MSETTTPRQRWTVRAGTTGLGMALFEVYAVTMDEARESVTRSAESELCRSWLPVMVGDGFTVHAGENARHGAIQRPVPSLYRNVFTADQPAVDYRPTVREMWDVADGVA